MIRMSNKVALYARFSSDNQRSESIDAQIRAMTAYCEQHHFVIVKTYVDEAKSATTDRRPAFQQMIRDSSSRIFNIILVHKLDRFARNRYDAGSYTADLEDRDIDMISVTQDFAPTPEGRLITHVMHGFNQYFSENLAKVCFDGLRSAAKNGMHCGGIPPLGYDVGEDKKLHINEWEADAVRLIFNMFEMSFSYTQIADRLNEMGYHTKAGQPFNKNSFTSILRQEKYCGKYVWNRARKKDSKGHRNTHQSKPEGTQVRIDNAVPIIIEQEQFDRVQAMINSRKGGKAGTNYRHHYLFSGMDVLVCSDCGSKMVGKNDNRSGTRYYYCPKHKQKECSMVDVKADQLEKFVVNQLVYDLYDRRDLVDVYNSVNHKDEIRKLEYHLRGVKTAINNTLKAIEKGTTPELEEKLNTLTADRNIVESRINDLRDQQKTMTESDRKAVCRELEKFLKDAKNCESKQYIRTTVGEIRVSNESIQLTINAA